MLNRYRARFLSAARALTAVSAFGAAAGCAPQQTTIATTTPVAARAAPIPPPGGRWEGEIATPRRALVMLVDFDSLHARFNTTGRTTFAVRELRADSAAIGFDVHAGRDTIPVRVSADAAALAGTATIGSDRYAVLLQRLPELPPPRDRAEAWRQDLDVVLNRFLRYDRSFDPAERAAFVRRIEALKDSAARLSDNELTVELARAVALSNNAHTRLYLVRNRTEVRRMPFRVWHFPEGWFVVRATDDYRDLLGCRLTRVHDMPITTAAARVRGIKPANDQWQRYMSTYMLTSAEILNGARIAPSADSVSYGFDCSGRARNRVVLPLPLQRTTESTEAWWDLSPFATRNARTSRTALPTRHAPLYLRNADRHYWFEMLPRNGILYFHYSRAENQPNTPTLRDFATGMLAAADSAQPRALVVDLRFNTGGNMGVGRPVMAALLEKFAGKPIYVITGQSTFSAGMSHVGHLKEGGARLVGEPVGDVLDTWSEGGNILLPNSRLTIHYTNGFHAYSRRAYPELEPVFADMNVDTLDPDMPVAFTWRDYIGGVDAAMRAIERDLARRR